MLNKKLVEVLSHEVDGAITVVSQGLSDPHLANTWNSYVEIVEDSKLLIPVGGFKKTEKNLLNNNKLKLSICNREVQGYNSKGTGLIVEGKGEFLKSGTHFDLMKEKFPWIRAVLSVTIDSIKQTL